MKAILMSIRPQHVVNILNGKKTIEIRKKFPKDYVGWVYIYCTKGKPNLWLPYEYDCFELDEASQPYLSDKPIVDIDTKMNGKVVARFWCDKVGSFSKEIFGTYEEPFTYNQDDLLKKSCLTEKELDIYLQGKLGRAIHIQKLEIFDKPKELAQHTHDDSSMFYTKKWDKVFKTWRYGALTRAPQSWCFIEV